MATKKKAPPRPKRAAKKKGAVKASVVNGSAKFDADQKPLNGMEDVKVPSVETAIKKIVDAQAQRIALKQEIDDQLGRLPGLFKKHELNQYACHGRKVSIEPGADVVKIKRVKDK